MYVSGLVLGVPWVKACCTGRDARLCATTLYTDRFCPRDDIPKLAQRCTPFRYYARVEVPPVPLLGLFWFVADAGALVQRRGCDNMSYQILLDRVFHCLTSDMR